MDNNGYEWDDDNLYNVRADQQELFEAVINELGRLGNVVHFQTNERRGRARTAYLTRVLGEVQALRVVIEDEEFEIGCEQNACVPGLDPKEVAPMEAVQTTLPMQVETSRRRYY